MSVTTGEHQDAPKELVLRELECILASPGFRSSKRSRVLLQYLVEHALAGDNDNLKERMIGMQVFSRDADYDTGQDSIVRVAANDVRKRLTDYYSHKVKNAGDSGVRIRLEAGSYLPEFELSEGDAGQAELAPHEPKGLAAGARLSIWRIAVPAFLLGCLAVYFGLSLRGPRTSGTVAGSPSQWTPALRKFWTPIAYDRTPVLIAYETRYFLFAGGLAIRDVNANTPSMADRSPSLSAVKKLFPDRQFRETSNYAETGGTQAVFFITRLLSPTKPAVSAKPFIDVTGDDLKRDHLVFLGKPSGDPTIRAALERGVFQDLGQGRIRVKTPAHGEPSEYVPQFDPEDPSRWGVKYALISVLSGADTGKRMLILTGAGTDELRALGAYVTSPETVGDLIRHVQKPSGELPQFYQVLIKAQLRSESPVQVEYVTHRALER